MTTIESQFESLQTAYPNALLERLGSGAYLITVPQYVLVPGWSKPQTDIKFIAPVGFPASRPDCFWVDHDLRLANGATPQNSGNNQLPEVSSQQWWFSWHVQAWEPNSGTLISYFRVIEKRLKTAQ